MLGGMYAEYVCTMAGLDKTQPATTANREKFSRL